MPLYVDGFVIAVPRKNVEKYRKISAKAGKVWKEHGALEYREFVGDDLRHQTGLSFPQTVKAKPSETVMFSWIVYKSRKHRDAVNKKVMKDKRIADMMTPDSMPFDIKKMAYGGFKNLVNL